MAEEQARTDVADIKVIPPVIFGGFLVGGLVLAAIWGVPVLPRVLAHGLGVCLLIAAGFVAVTAFQAMKRQGTAVHPRTPTDALVTDGPFAYSRNPLYLSLLAIYGGLALLVNSLLMVLLGVAMFFTLQRHVVEPEERYLAEKFGDAYQDYLGRVRRWL